MDGLFAWTSPWRPFTLPAQGLLRRHVPLYSLLGTPLQNCTSQQPCSAKIQGHVLFHLTLFCPFPTPPHNLFSPNSQAAVTPPKRPTVLNQRPRWRGVPSNTLFARLCLLSLTCLCGAAPPIGRRTLSPLWLLRRRARVETVYGPVSLARSHGRPGSFLPGERFRPRCPT